LTIAITLHVNIVVVNGLLIQGNDVSFQQPRKINSHPHMSGEPLGGSPNGGSLNRNPPRRPLLNPLVGFYGWSALDPKMFVPPSYPLVIV
jgi:hypothetical protein